MDTQQVSAPSRASSRVPGRVTAFGVIHVNAVHTSRFTIVGNHLAQHGELSLTAIGLAVHIQSLPDGAKIGIKVLAERFPESEAPYRRRAARTGGARLPGAQAGAGARRQARHAHDLVQPAERRAEALWEARATGRARPSGRGGSAAARPEAVPCARARHSRPRGPTHRSPPHRGPGPEHRHLRPRCSPSRRSPTWSGSALPPTSSPGSAGTSPGCFWPSATSAAWRPPSPPGSNATLTPTTYAAPSLPTCPSL